MKKVNLERMSWTEVKEAFALNPVVMIPMGSMEEHGPHSPMGDYRIAAVAAERIAEKTGALVTPIIPFGYSEYFKGFPGTISLRPEIMSGVVEDVCECLIRHGLDHLVLVNGHAGNTGLLEHVARKIKAVHGITMAMFAPLAFVTSELKKELYGADVDKLGHGGDPMGSLNLYLWPEDVNTRAVAPQSRMHQGFVMQGLAAMKFKDTSVNFYLDMDEITPDGTMGDPAMAKAERGEKMMERMVSYGVEFIQAFKKMKTRLKG
jgi:creatinine amidohydrolase